MPVKRGVAVWISGFLTFVAALSLIAVVIYWTRADVGPNSILRPYLVGDIITSLIGDLRVETYFWISLVATFIFLGITCVVAYRKLPPDPEIVKMFVKVGGNLAAVKKTQETTATQLVENIENTRKTSQELFTKVNTNFDDAKKETLAVLEKQETTIQEVERLSKQGAVALKKQKAELEDMRIRLEKIEEKMIPPKPRLKGQDNPEEIRGIGPRLGEELKALGITNVGELITADPAIIDEKTRVSRDMAEHLQATAQLLMIPGVNENDAELLVEAGITSRKELGDQDLVPLSRKISEIAKTRIKEGKISKDEKPTIEEISSWIRMARY